MITFCYMVRHCLSRMFNIRVNILTSIKVTVSNYSLLTKSLSLFFVKIFISYWHLKYLLSKLQLNPFLTQYYKMYIKVRTQSVEYITALWFKCSTRRLTVQWINDDRFLLLSKQLVIKNRNITIVKELNLTKWLKPINVKLQVIIIASPVSIWLLRYCDDIRDTYIREMLDKSSRRSPLLYLP